MKDVEAILGKTCVFIVLTALSHHQVLLNLPHGPFKVSNQNEEFRLKRPSQASYFFASSLFFSKTQPLECFWNKRRASHCSNCLDDFETK